MGKRKIVNEDDINNIQLPVANDILGVAVKFLGFDRIMVKCQDGHERLCRIRGKMKRRAWIRLGDIVLVSPWDMQSDIRGDPKKTLFAPHKSARLEKTTRDMA